MTPFHRMNAESSDPPKKGLVPRHYWLVVLAILLVSLLIHIYSVVELGDYQPKTSVLPAAKQAPVKFHVMEPKGKKKAKKPELPKIEPETLPKILEMPQVKTAPPEKADYAGVVNHQTAKETRVSDKIKRQKAADAGNKGNPDARPNMPEGPKVEKPAQEAVAQKLKQNDTKLKETVGSLAVDSYQPKPRNDYEALLPTSPADLPGQINAGYQDYVDDKITVGDRVDINTAEYRYIGYFTSMRKAIELVWNYPLDAARKGEQGEVGLEFIISKDGHVNHIRIIKSSGYDVLDQAIVQAIGLAQPFSPLPDGFGKNRLVVTGSFRYILNSF